MAPVFYFGRRWDDPALDNTAVNVVTPHGRCCGSCDEVIGRRDRGLMRNTVRREHTPVTHLFLFLATVTPGWLFSFRRQLLARATPRTIRSLQPLHAECAIRDMVGGVAHWYGDDAEPFMGTRREEARAVIVLLNKDRADVGKGPVL